MVQMNSQNSKVPTPHCRFTLSWHFMAHAHTLVHTDMVAWIDTHHMCLSHMHTRKQSSGLHTSNNINKQYREMPQAVFHFLFSSRGVCHAWCHAFPVCVCVIQNNLQHVHIHMLR